MKILAALCFSFALFGCAPAIAAEYESTQVKSLDDLKPGDIVWTKAPAPPIFVADSAPGATASTAAIASQAAANIVGPTAAPAPVDPNTDFFNLLIQSIGGVKGASALAIAAMVVQLLLKLLSTSWVGQWFPRLAGGTKLLIVTGLSLLAGVLALMMPPTSLTLGAAVMHSTTMAAFGVFMNQFYQQFSKPSGTAPPAT